MSWLLRWLGFGPKPPMLETAYVDLLDQEVITPDNPLYTVLMTAAAENRPVIATYDVHTGEIVHSEVLR